MSPQTQVLIVGAGPVGLMTALELHNRGINARIVEEKDKSDARSFAVVLHPRVLGTLIDLGLSETLLWQGCPLKHVAVFTEGEKRATLKLRAASEASEGGLTLPQNVLRHALERTLHERGIDVCYRQHLASLELNPASVHVRLTGPDAPASTLVTDFVVGADGRGSTIRAQLGLTFVPKGADETYAFFDVPRDPRAGNRIELALTGELSSAMIPLHGGMMRYAFQLAAAPLEILDLKLLRALLAERLPWHHDAPERIEWSGVATFGRGVVDRFGYGRVWLAGDAAHATSPLGVQSLNVGLCEARELAATIADCARAGSLELLGSRYETQRRAEWNRLLAANPGAPLPPRVPQWVRQHLSRLISSLPVSGDDLDDALDQLGVSLL
jgi:2-polyprenyl-6-methoxyphenol hydroxylase-like FAD-dependent oxidoreductase